MNIDATKQALHDLKWALDVAERSKKISREHVVGRAILTNLDAVMAALNAAAAEPVATTMAGHVAGEIGYCKFHATVPFDAKLYLAPTTNPTPENAG